MNKIKLFVDCDNTLTSSTECIAETYNFLYQRHPNFIPADWTIAQKWNFEDICPLLKSEEKVLEIFEHPLFFESLKLIDENTYDVIKKANEKYQIIVVSIGTPRNLALKSLYLLKTLPFIKDYILLYNEGCSMNKEIVRMNYKDSIFIDDVTSNLDSTDAQNKIIFGKLYPWSQTNGYKRCFDWSEVEKELL